MVEQHRRVEPRHIVGTGMATDPERIDRVRHDAERRERDTREQPVEGFGDVLGRAPPRGELADEPPPRDPAQAAPDAAHAEPPSSTTKPEKRAPERTTPRAPDPRARLLHAQIKPRGSPSAPAAADANAGPAPSPAPRPPRS